MPLGRRSTPTADRLHRNGWWKLLLHCKILSTSQCLLGPTSLVERHQKALCRYAQGKGNVQLQSKTLTVSLPRAKHHTQNIIPDASTSRANYKPTASSCMPRETSSWHFVLAWLAVGEAWGNESLPQKRCACPCSKHRAKYGQNAQDISCSTPSCLGAGVLPVPHGEWPCQSFRQSSSSKTECSVSSGSVLL